MPPAENSETPKYNLPPPIDSGNESIENLPDQQAGSTELLNKIKAPKTASPISVDDFQITDPVTVQVASTQTSTSNNPQIADDNDLIEKEWVAKAKQIIEANKEDPFIQSKEMTEFRADYMQKRYNKTIKASE
jgi:hypothetical protein